MHETLNKFYRGNIDSIKKEGKFYVVRGWVVPLVAADKCFIGCDGFVSVHPEERPDIYILYKQTHINYLRCGFKLVLNPSIEKVTIMVNELPVFEVEMEKFEHVLTPNENNLPRLIVVEDFYENPDSVRDYALKQDFTERMRQKRSAKSFVPHWISEHFERFLNKKIILSEDSGIFYYNTCKEIIMHDYIKQDYMACVFLNNPYFPETGISFYTENPVASYKDIYDKVNYQLVDKVDNKFNRLVLFNKKFIPAATAYCGNNLQTARLIQTFNISIIN